MSLGNLKSIGLQSIRSQAQSSTSSIEKDAGVWSRKTPKNPDGTRQPKPGTHTRNAVFTPEPKLRGGATSYHNFHNTAINSAGVYLPNGAVHSSDTNQVFAMHRRAADLFRTVEHFPNHLGQIKQNLMNYSRTHNLSNVTPGQFTQNMHDVAQTLNGAYGQTVVADGPNGQYDPYFGKADTPLAVGDVGEIAVGDVGAMAFGRNSSGAGYVEYRMT